MRVYATRNAGFREPNWQCVKYACLRSAFAHGHVSLVALAAGGGFCNFSARPYTCRPVQTAGVRVSDNEET